MFSYKVEYIHAQQEKSKWYESKGGIDAWSLSKELEALLVEYEAKEYKVISIVPVQTYKVIHGTFAGTLTEGLIVTFEKQRHSS